MDPNMRQYWPIRNELAITDGNVRKDKRIMFPFQLQKQILQQLHTNHMEIESMRLLVCESVYLLDMNADIENTLM